MNISFSPEQKRDLIQRGFSRRNFGRMAAMLTASATLPFYNESALAQLSAQVDLQANVLGFINAFWMLGFLVLFLIPLPFLMRRPSAEEAKATAAAH